MSETLSDGRRALLHRRVRLIVAFTIIYNVIEAIVSIVAGVTSSSTALIGFGLDSAIEVTSAVAVAWQFTRKDPERWEKATVRAIACAFFALAAYVVADTAFGLFEENTIAHSPLGIVITVMSIVLMPLLAMIETQTGRELGSRSVQADAKQLLLCVYLSGTVLIGLLANSLFNWTWADRVAALVVAVLAIREGIEAWRGDVESGFEVIEKLKE
ncbi:MAG: cation transporter [Propionibacteriaceae bacterium]|jgi:divalent metal cation (Fe/Co/Zn/Cd) transporter|nr:cation transporter [Propionibacteriaceae bacterium]